MRKSNKAEAFKLVRRLNHDTGDTGAVTDTPLDDAILTRYWTGYRCAELPEPLDAIWLQCVIVLPADVAVRLLQHAAYLTPSGVLDDAVLADILKAATQNLEEWLLRVQGGYYFGLADRALCGFDLASGLRRIDRCNEWLVEWIMARRPNEPLHSVK